MFVLILVQSLLTRNKSPMVMVEFSTINMAPLFLVRGSEGVLV